MSREAVIAAARADLGYCEEPVNRTKYWQAYDPSFQGQPWCVACQWFWFDQAGERMAFFGGGKTASCSILLRWYREQGLTVPVDDVQEGDIVLYNFHGGTSPEHCGLVESTPPKGNLYVCTIEGNTASSGSGNQSNGGEVCRKVRRTSQIVAVCRPTYKEEEMPKTDYENHWAEQHIRWAMEAGIMQGYPDGSFQPDKPVTRAELATILHRYHAKEGVK